MTVSDSIILFGIGACVLVVLFAVLALVADAIEWSVCDVRKPKV